jgi:hypothetical protein
MRTAFLLPLQTISLVWYHEEEKLFRSPLQMEQVRKQFGVQRKTIENESRYDMTVSRGGVRESPSRNDVWLTACWMKLEVIVV